MTMQKTKAAGYFFQTQARHPRRRWQVLVPAGWPLRNSRKQWLVFLREGNIFLDIQRKLIPEHHSHLLLDISLFFFLKTSPSSTRCSLGGIVSCVRRCPKTVGRRVPASSACRWGWRRNWWVWRGTASPCITQRNTAGDIWFPDGGIIWILRRKIKSLCAHTGAWLVALQVKRLDTHSRREGLFLKSSW